MTDSSEENLFPPAATPATPSENAPPITPAASARPDLPPSIAQMFSPRHDWQALFVAFKEWVAQGLGTDKAFAISQKIPYGSFARHAVKFRQRMAADHAKTAAGTEGAPLPGLEAAPFSSLRSPTALASGLSSDNPRPVAGLHSRDQGARMMEDSSPAPELFTREAKAVERGFKGAIAKLRAKAPELASRLLDWTERQDNPASVAAIKEAFALLREAEKDAPEVSFFEKNMTNEEIGLIVRELWPLVEAERDTLIEIK